VYKRQALAHASMRVPRVTLSWWVEGISELWPPGSLIWPLTGVTLFAGLVETTVISRSIEQRGAGWITRWHAATQPIGPL